MKSTIQPPPLHEDEHVDYQEALEASLEGRFTEALRELYQSPQRDQVPWLKFPNWARPTDPVEGGHEGGSI